MLTEMPKNFSWLENHPIAALGFPESAGQLKFLVQQNIGYLVSLTKEAKPPVDQVPGLKWIDLGVEDFCSFSLEQVELFVKVCEEAHRNNVGIAVHCRAGKGRTGTLLACYLIRFQDFQAKAAIAEVRRQRPGSIETDAQERTIADYFNHLNNQ